MIIKEYRVVLPMNVREYKIAQLFAITEASKNETGGGEGIEILQNEPYSEESEKGQYTKKIYHLESRVPSFVKYGLPKGSLQLEEHAWDAYPKCKTVLSNHFFGEKFEIKIQSMHLPDCGTTENIFKLSPAEWKKCEVVNIDIANDPVNPEDYKREYDPTLVHFQRAPHHALGKHWLDEARMNAKMNHTSGGSAGSGSSSNGASVMCAYKLVKCRLNVWGLQGKVENMIHRQERRLFTTFHRQVFCLMDKWYGMTMEDIRRLEHETQAELARLIKKGEVRGTTVK